ncbi:conserved hypothetical protein [Neospora caninum Liverpool]|uniref:Uncharacterized protein n=1 Tax=Neospora caninum (strain Liverpool) TaxID=572307 RepID=F0VFT7_NEOCL|nr:conserved hypothetical protein [Neospora caninum Liverpool]CBZ52581.1 conserved hypothetical protein [Neospora caninum Liverpool]CEL66559.1 TPA: hypothetical protein BN1204_023690 [Neospora caninum Liverpool]|eukprot:XP_003882613.1 conserved hypothetical protein [Neospora caninum Liverpool]
MPPALALEEQYEDLLKRFQIMDAERKTTYEAAHHAIRYNQGLMKQLKDQNLQIRNQLKVLKKNKILTAPEHLQKKMDEVSKLRLQLDQMKNHNVGQRRTLASLQDKLRELEIAAERPNTEASPELKQIRVIENRLDQAMIKLNEAQSIRSTYEQIVTRLKDERLGLDQHLAQLEKTLKVWVIQAIKLKQNVSGKKEKDNDYEELLALSHDATHASELAQAELHRVSQAIEQERANREQEVEEKRALVQACVTANQKIAEEAVTTKQKVEEDRMKTMAQVHESNPTEGDGCPTLEDYENVFRRIKQATGVSDVNEVIQKFLMQEETRENLVSLAKELEEMKLSSVTKQSKWPVVDDLEISASQANARHERARSKYEKNCQLLVELQAGVEHLYEKLMSTTQTNPQLRREASAVQPSVEWMVQASLQKLDYLVKRTKEGLKREQQRLQEETEKQAEQAADHARQVDSLLSPGPVPLEKSSACHEPEATPGNDDRSPSDSSIPQMAEDACVCPVFDYLPPASPGRETGLARKRTMEESEKFESPSETQREANGQSTVLAHISEVPSSSDVSSGHVADSPERFDGQQTNEAQNGLRDEMGGTTEEIQRDVNTSAFAPSFPIREEDEGKLLSDKETLGDTEWQELSAKHEDCSELEASTEKENTRGDREDLQRRDDSFRPHGETGIQSDHERDNWCLGHTPAPDRASPVPAGFAFFPSEEAGAMQQPSRVENHAAQHTFEPRLNEARPVTDGGKIDGIENGSEEEAIAGEHNRVAEERTEPGRLPAEGVPTEEVPSQSNVSSTPPEEKCAEAPRGPATPESDDPLGSETPSGPQGSEINVAEGDDGEALGACVPEQPEPNGVGVAVVSPAEQSLAPELPSAQTAQLTAREAEMVESPLGVTLAVEPARNRESEGRDAGHAARESDSDSGGSPEPHPQGTGRAAEDVCKEERAETHSIPTGASLSRLSRPAFSSSDPGADDQDSSQPKDLGLDLDSRAKPAEQESAADLALERSDRTPESRAGRAVPAEDTQLGPSNSDQQTPEPVGSSAEKTVQEQSSQENVGEPEETLASLPLQEAPETGSSSPPRATARPVDGEAADDDGRAVRIAVSLCVASSSKGAVGEGGNHCGDEEIDAGESGHRAEHVHSTVKAALAESTGQGPPSGGSGDPTFGEAPGNLDSQSGGVLDAEAQQLSATSGPITLSAEVGGAHGNTEKCGGDGKVEGLDEGCSGSLPGENGSLETPEADRDPATGGSPERTADVDATVEPQDLLHNRQANDPGSTESEAVDVVSEASAETC